MRKYLRLYILGIIGFFTASTFVFAQTLIDEESDSGACADIRQTIRYGDTDARLQSNSVALLQDFLMERGYLKIQGGAPNGFFGKATLSAVKAFQTAAGIKPTGTVGLATRAKIKAVDCQGQAIAYNPRTTNTTTNNTNTTGTNTTINTTNRPAPEMTLSLSKTPVSVDEPFELSWTSANAGNCKFRGEWVGANSRMTIRAGMTGSTNYEVTCYSEEAIRTNATTPSISKTVTVQVTGTNTTNTTTTNTNTNNTTGTNTTNTNSSTASVTISGGPFAWNVAPTISGQSVGVIQFGFSISKNGEKYDGTGNTIFPATNGAWSYTFPRTVEPGKYTVTAYNSSNVVLGRGEFTVNDWVGGCANPPVIDAPDAYVGVAYRFDPGVRNYSAPYPNDLKGLKKENGVFLGTATTTGNLSLKIQAENTCGAAIVKINIKEGLKVKQIAQTTTSATYEITSPSSIFQKLNSCVYSQGFFGSSGNGFWIKWGDSTVTEPVYTDAKRGTSCTNVVKKHTYTKTGKFTITAGSWYPGPTDMPIEDWTGSTTVTVSFAQPSSSVTLDQQGKTLTDGRLLLTGTFSGVSGGAIKVLVINPLIGQPVISTEPLNASLNTSTGRWEVVIPGPIYNIGSAYTVRITDGSGNLLKEASVYGGYVDPTSY